MQNLVGKDSLQVTRNALAIIKELRLRDVRFGQSADMSIHQLGERAYYQKLCEFAEKNGDVRRVEKYSGKAKVCEFMDARLAAACKTDDLENNKRIIDSADLFLRYNYSRNFFGFIWNEFPVNIIEHLYQNKRLSLSYRIGTNNVTIFHGIALKYLEDWSGQNVMPENLKEYAKKLAKEVGSEFLNKVDSAGKTALDYAKKLRRHQQYDIGKLIADTPLLHIDTYDPLDYINAGPPSYDNHAYYTILREASAKHSTELGKSG